MKAPYLLKKELMQLPPQQLADLLHDMGKRCPAVKDAMVRAAAKRPVGIAFDLAIHFATHGINGSKKHLNDEAASAHD